MDFIDVTSPHTLDSDPTIINQILGLFANSITSEMLKQLRSALYSRNDLLNNNNVELLLHVLQTPSLHEEDLSLLDMAKLALLNGRRSENLVAMLMEIAYDTRRNRMDLATLLRLYPNELKLEDLMTLHRSLYKRSLYGNRHLNPVYVSSLTDELEQRGFRRNPKLFAIIIHKLAVLSHMDESKFFDLIDQIWEVKFKAISVRNPGLSFNAIVDILGVIEKEEA